MPTKTPTSQLSRKECKKRDWEIIGGEIWVPSHAARAVVDAAKRWSRGADLMNAVELLNQLHEAVKSLEKFGPGVRQDIGGFIDLLCLGELPLHKQEGIDLPCILGIQVTSRGGLSARRKKMQTECLDKVRRWIACGGILYLHGWDQPKGPGTRYRLKEEQVLLDGDSIKFVDAEEPKF